MWSTLAGRADAGREVADTRYVLTDVLQGRNAAARNAAGWDVGLREPDKHLAGQHAVTGPVLASGTASAGVREVLPRPAASVRFVQVHRGGVRRGGDCC